MIQIVIFTLANIKKSFKNIIWNELYKLSVK